DDFYFLFFFGTGKENLDLGPVCPQDCEVCQREQPFRLGLLYRYEHVMFVFRNARALSYILICEECETIYRIPRKAALKLGRLDGDPIAFWERYGCLVLFAIFFVVALVGVILDR